MSTLRRSVLRLPTSPLGPANPLPPLRSPTDLHAVADVEAADDELRRNLGYGHLPSVLPYLLQSDYGRELVEVEHPTAVLENDVLRATFLLGLGGRLWSLVHRPSGRELLYRNPALQLANLALRDAWFAGGVEWNLGLTGHTPLTCEPLHAGRVDLGNGTPLLRLYEYERMRGLVYQVDAWLPEDVPHLMVHVTVTNPTGETVPVYWWSNVAVPESEDVRVLTPARSAWKFGPDRVLRQVEMPVEDGVDRSYSTRSPAAVDYFFDLQASPRPWIAAVDGSGAGLVQTSSRRLRGRKLFLWGSGSGGRHWQQWLSPRGGRYLEIQAGLARTQLEHLPLPAGERWSWLETYGLLTGDPARLHDPDWSVAAREVEDRLEELVPTAVFGREAARGAAAVDQAPAASLQAGSGWGALEARRRAVSGEPALTLPGTPFGEQTLGPEQQPWLDLLEHGTMRGVPSEPPSSYAVAPGWRALLSSAQGWLPALHRGVAEAYTGEDGRALASWQKSLRDQPTAWAWRSVAALLLPLDPSGALAAYRQARRLAPGLAPLLVEQLTAMLAAGRPEEVLETVDGLSPSVRPAPDVGLLEASAAVRLGDVGRAAAVLEPGLVLPQLREGAQHLAELWYDYRALRLAAAAGRLVDEELWAQARAEPLPTAYDFSMAAPAT